MDWLPKGTNFFHPVLIIFSLVLSGSGRFLCGYKIHGHSYLAKLKNKNVVSGEPIISGKPECSENLLIICQTC